MTHPGGDDDHIVWLNLSNNAATTAELNPRRAALNPQNLVRLCVIMRERKNAVAPTATPTVFTKKCLENRGVPARADPAVTAKVILSQGIYLQLQDA